MAKARPRPFEQCQIEVIRLVFMRSRVLPEAHFFGFFCGPFF
jgi:hypothetical protein